jgi:hypothetical protein
VPELRAALTQLVDLGVDSLDRAHDPENVVGGACIPYLRPPKRYSRTTTAPTPSAT